MHFIVKFLIPLITMIVLNTIIVLKIRQANKTRSNLTNQEKSDHGLAKMFSIVIVVFIFCNSWIFIYNILESFEIVHETLEALTTLMITFNSAINIVIYCAFGQKFRKSFKETFRFSRRNLVIASSDRRQSAETEL